MKSSWIKLNRWTRPVVRIAILIGIAVGVGYWVRFSPTEVLVHTVERGPIVAEVMGTGTLEARIEATISPKISGRIEEVVSDQGDRVKAGDLLLRLDDNELRQEVAIAEANLDAATAALQRLKTEKTRAIAVYAQAKTANDRRQTLLNKNAVSREEADKASEAFAVATAVVSSADAAITEGHKEVLAAEKTLEFHRARLKDTEVYAPFDGLITRRHRESGDVVVPGSSVLTLVSTDELWVSAWVDETEMARLRSGQAARVVFRAEPGKSYPGKVVRLGKEADRETREFVVDVRVLELPINWAVGQRAEAYIQVAQHEEALLLPARFVIVRNRETGVFVNDSGVATWRDVATGLRSREHVEVLEGLKAGEAVIIPRDERNALSNGKRISMP